SRASSANLRQGFRGTRPGSKEALGQLKLAGGFSAAGARNAEYDAEKSLASNAFDGGNPGGGGSGGGSSGGGSSGGTSGSSSGGTTGGTTSGTTCTNDEIMNADGSCTPLPTTQGVQNPANLSFMNTISSMVNQASSLMNASIRNILIGTALIAAGVKLLSAGL